MKEIKILHLFPVRMSLYGEYGNLVALKDTLQQLGCSVTVDAWEQGDLEPENYDLLYMGCGTETALRTAARLLLPHRQALRQYVEKGGLLLATGNAMGAFGTSLDGQEALGLLEFTTRITDKRYLGDALTEPAFGAPVLGFVNTSCVYSGLQEGLWQLRLGAALGSDKKSAWDGVQKDGFFATQLTGPLLVKNPHLLALFVGKLTGEPYAPKADSYIQKAYEVSARELQRRLENGK